MVHLERRRIEIPGAEHVSIVIATPDSPLATAPVVVLAHGAGNDMDSPFLSDVHTGLAERGFFAIKFNFPYKERGGRAPDRAPVLEACFRSVLSHIRSDPQLATRRMVIGGKSMGGRMATHLAAQGEAVAGVLLLGYPLHPAGKPEQLRDAHLGKVHVPMLFFAGTRDALCRLDLLQHTLKPLRAAQLHVIEGGDHSFATPKSMQRSPQAVMEEILESTAAWLRQL